MFIDSVVLAGVLTVFLMLAFFGGIGFYAYQQLKKKVAESDVQSKP